MCFFVCFWGENCENTGENRRNSRKYNENPPVFPWGKKITSSVQCHYLGIWKGN